MRRVDTHNGDYINPDLTYLFVDNRGKKTVYAGKRIICFYMYSKISFHTDKLRALGGWVELSINEKTVKMFGKENFMQYLFNNYDSILDYCIKENIIRFNPHRGMLLRHTNVIYYELESEEEINKYKLLTLV